MLAPLQKLVTALRDDLRDCLDGKTDEPADRKAQLAEARQRVQAEYDATKKAERTAQAFPAWREDYLTQVAVAWVLACVFVRYLEDNEFVADCWLGGPDDHRRQEAQARHGGFFRENKTATDRDYLLAVFRRTAAIPAAADLFAEGKTPLWVVGPSADAATRLVNFWHARDAEGDIPTFTAADGDTRFLGDLYQDLSEDVRKTYALRQTPEFVEEFILDRTLDPACREFGFQHVRLIDPTCGSGHFLLGAFDRLMRLWQKHYHELTSRDWNPQDAAGRVLGDGGQYPGQVYGADINPYAAAIARFRLLIAACKWCGVVRLKDAPGWRPQVFCGDSLYHGRRWPVCSNKPKEQQMTIGDWDRLYHFEDVDDVRRVLSQKYHAVVGNPPYIQGKDSAARKLYRERYISAYDKFAMSAPFTERFWDLCLAAESAQPGGFVGMITANNFMKREFGKKLIEAFFPQIDLTHVLDTSWVYLPNHGDSPTTILFGRNQVPQGDTVRAVFGIKGEADTPEDPAHGQVWISITDNVDTRDAQTEFVSVSDVPRETFAHHPWSIGGGGAAELKEQLDDVAEQTLGNVAESIGITSVTGEDDVYMFPDARALQRHGITDFIPLVEGDLVRDWKCDEPSLSLWPYDVDLKLRPLEDMPGLYRVLWPTKATISLRRRFGTPMLLKGAKWYEWQELYRDKLRSPLSITLAEVATHNHFVLDRGGKVFKQTAPIIKLATNATLDQHIQLLGLLNSSTACFWMKQVCFPKGTASGDISSEKGKPEANRYAFSSTAISGLPIPNAPSALVTQLLELSRRIVGVAEDKQEYEPKRVLSAALDLNADAGALRDRLQAAGEADALCLRRMVYLQEEIDWTVYATFGLAHESLAEPNTADIELELEDRPFRWSSPYGAERIATTIRETYRKRWEAVQAHASLRLIETPVYKRLWLGRQGVYGSAKRTYAEKARDALRSWLLDRLETERYWPRGEPALRSCDQLANEAAADPEFLHVAAVYKGGLVEPAALITELVTAEAVPYLPVQRYKESGLRKRAVWEETWALQRREDAGEKLPEPIPVPPKYTSADFLKGDYWRLRGKLDVPKERWVSYPGAERDGDPTPVVTWAGYDHLGQARALAAYYQEAKDQRGWPTEKLVPLLAGLDQLVPWLKQWHNEYSEEFDGKPGDEMERVLTSTAADLRVSLDTVRGWKPEPTTAKRGRKKS